MEGFAMGYKKHKKLRNTSKNKIQRMVKDSYSHKRIFTENDYSSQRRVFNF